jgi:hypothetical protein
MEKENPPRLLRAHQKYVALIASRGWKSSNSSPLSVEGEVFSLTFPFIEQALALKTPSMGSMSAMAMLRQLSDDPARADRGLPRS